MLLSIFKESVYSQEASDIIDLPITQDSYAKEYWPGTTTAGYPHLSLGNSNIYPEKRTQMYFNFDISNIKDINASPGDILSAEITLTQFIHMSDGDYFINIYDVPNPINLSQLNWATKPPLGSTVTEHKILSSERFRTIPITNQLKTALSENRELFGIAILMKNDKEPGSLYYSQQCQNGTFYQPQCEPGMEPYAKIYLNNPLSPAFNVIYNEINFNLFEIEFRWEKVEESFCRVNFIKDGLNTISTEWTEKTDITQNFEEYGKYNFNIECRRQRDRGIIAKTEDFIIELLDLSLIKPNVIETENNISVENSYNLPILWTIKSLVSAETFILKDQLDKNEICNIFPNQEKIFVNAKLSKNETFSMTSDSLNITCKLPENNTANNLIKKDVINPVLPKKETVKKPTPLKVKIIKPNPPKNDYSVYENLIGYWLDKDKNNPKIDSKKLTLKCNKNYKDGFTCHKSQIRAEVVSCENLSIDKIFCRLKVVVPLKVEILEENIFCNLFNFSNKNECDSIKYESLIPKYNIYYEKSEIGIFTNNENNGNYLITTKPFTIKEDNSFEFETKLFTPKVTNQSLFQVKESIQFEILSNKFKQYQYPFSETIGVTQWHGYTAYDSPHTGIDFGSTNKSVKAISSGTIQSSGYDLYFGKCNSGGYFINIKHDDGRHSVYLHLDEKRFKELNLKKGEKIKKDQEIGLSGNSGAYNCQKLGYHLHLELRENSKQESHIDPVKFINYDWLKVPTLNSKIYPGRLTGDNPHPEY